MATIHQATLTPTKLELLASWLPGRRWYPDDVTKDLERIAACRFDDPAGEVGVETFVVRAGDGPLVHVPMTYRAAPLAGGDHFLIGRLAHSVLGERWVYDAVGDPVYITALAAAIRTGGREAEEFVETPDGPRRRDPLMTVRGSGSAKDAPDPGPLVRVEDGDPVVVATHGVRVEVRRVLTGESADGPLNLTGTWPSAPRRYVLAVLG
jgi:hypothetical protein